MYDVPGIFTFDQSLNSIKAYNLMLFLKTQIDAFTQSCLLSTNTLPPLFLIQFKLNDNNPLGLNSTQYNLT